MKTLGFPYCGRLWNPYFEGYRGPGKGRLRLEAHHTRFIARFLANKNMFFYPKRYLSWVKFNGMAWSPEIFNTQINTHDLAKDQRWITICHKVKIDVQSKTKSNKQQQKHMIFQNPTLRWSHLKVDLYPSNMETICSSNPETKDPPQKNKNHALRLSVTLRLKYQKTIAPFVPTGLTWQRMFSMPRFASGGWTKKFKILSEMVVSWSSTAVESTKSP